MRIRASTSPSRWPTSGLGDFPRELAAIQRALQRAEQTGARLLVARGRLFEGRSYFSQGELAKAEQSLEAARQMFIDAGDRAGAASALNSLGSVLGDQQDITRSQRMYEQSLATSEEIGDRRAMSAALNNLGILLKDQGQLVEARRAHERSLALRREIGDRNWTAVSLSNIGVVLFEEDRLREATAYYKESLAISPRDWRQARAGPGPAQPGHRRAGNGPARRRPARASRNRWPCARKSATRAGR